MRLPRAVAAAELADGRTALEALVAGRARAVEIRGRWVDAAWQLTYDLATQLREDVATLGSGLPSLRPDDALLLGDEPVFVEPGARVEPQVCFDTSRGPVLIRRGAIVHAFTRVNGPCYIGEHSAVLGARLGTCVVGEWCKVGGEVHSTIFLGHANKAHEGFVGHSYLGRWVNLGAGTITSNLKNTYGPVAIRTAAGEQRDTGLQFLGTMFGDHAKTGIGTRLTTGTVVGAGANVFGSAMPPKYVPPFAWGDGEPYETYRLDKFLEVAERVMARRDVELTQRMRRQLGASYALAAPMAAGFR